MSKLSSSLADNLSEGFCNYDCTNCKSFLDYLVFKDGQLTCRCFECKRNYRKDFNKDLIKTFASICEFSDRVRKIVLLLRKRIYPYEYMDSLEGFDEKLFPDKKAFYSTLKKDDITAVYYRYAKRVYK